MSGSLSQCPEAGRWEFSDIIDQVGSMGGLWLRVGQRPSFADPFLKETFPDLIICIDLPPYHLSSCPGWHCFWTALLLSSSIRFCSRRLGIGWGWSGLVDEL